MSSSRFEASPSGDNVLRGAQYPGLPGTEATSPGDVAFQCEIESKDSSGNVETERPHLEFRDKNQNGSYVDDNWECN